MSHQFLDNEHFDFASSQEAQTFSEFRNFKLNLLVKAEIKKISKKTSNPKWVSEHLNLYIGLQSHHQIQLCKLFFMQRMQEKKAYSHEIQVLAKKTIYEHKWRSQKELDSKVNKQCASIVGTRISLMLVHLRNWNKINMKVSHMFSKLVARTKLRMAKNTFDREVWRIHLMERDSVHAQQCERFSKKTDGILRKKEVVTSRVLLQDLKGVIM